MLSLKSPKSLQLPFAMSMLMLCPLFAAGGCHSLTHPDDDSAPPRTSPSSLVESFYRGDSPAVWPENAQHRSPLLSARLSAAVAVSQRTYGQFFLTFDPIVNGQDALIEDLVVHPALIDGDRAWVTVRFRNFDQDNALVYSFVSEDGRWKLDELASIGGDTRWLLTEVLQNP